MIQVMVYTNRGPPMEMKEGEGGAIVNHGLIQKPNDVPFLIAVRLQ